MLGLGCLNSRNDWADERTDLAGRILFLLFYCFDGCLDGTALLVPEHHKERNAELEHAEFHPTDLRIVRYRRPDTADEQVTETAVEDQLWRHTGVDTTDDAGEWMLSCSHAHATPVTQVRIIVFRVNEAGVSFLQF